MKITVEINSRFVKGLLVTCLVLGTLALGKTVLNVNNVQANGYYEGPVGTYEVQHLGSYPDVHLFKRTGKKMVCLGVCKVDEEGKTSKWVPFK